MEKQKKTFSTARHHLQKEKAKQRESNDKEEEEEEVRLKSTEFLQKKLSKEDQVSFFRPFK